MREAGGRVEKIWIKRCKGGPMDAVSRARAVAGRGLEGNANLGGKRQVILLTADAWQTVRSELGVDVDPSLRRANLLLSGIDLVDRRGWTLKVGDCRVRIHTECKPCRRMEEAQPGLQDALRADWRGGACGELLDSGTIEVGDVVVWLEEAIPGAW
jgi:MOSC domain-containing protein YiiM